MNLQPYLDFTAELAAASAEIIVPLFGARECGLEIKADDSPVTIADRESERVMRQMIERKFPDHGIIGEEFGYQNVEAEWVWVLDPVDGTRSFVAGIPLFGTLIGLLHNGKPVVGCVNQPILKQLLLGDNHTATLNGETVRASQSDDLKRALLLTTDPLRPANCHCGERWGNLACEVGTVRTWGDCYGFLMVATGRAEMMIDTRMAAWDILPIVPCLRGAGARISSWDGSPMLDFEPSHLEGKPYSCVASAPALHDEVLALLNA